MNAQGWLFPDENDRQAGSSGDSARGDPAESPEALVPATRAELQPPASGTTRLPGAAADHAADAQGAPSASSAGGSPNKRQKARGKASGSKQSGPRASPVAPWEGEDEFAGRASDAPDTSGGVPLKKGPATLAPGGHEQPIAEEADGPEALVADTDQALAAETVLSVSELTACIKELLESRFTSVWVSGEIGDLSRPQSGHCYLVLKDAESQIAAVIWRSTAGRLKFDLHDGLEVVCRGRIEVYGPRGKYQLVIDQIEPRGMGALELALRQLRERLAREGLFDVRHKRPLPRFVRQIAVVTSPSGAALRDFLEVLRRRWRGADVLVIPVRVQGEGAAEEIAAAIRLANRLQRPIDCLAVVRGGGSLEDLWAFNEEVVVRAIRQSRIPVVSGVGHEIDVTLADLAADVRALTPSEAAERIVPSAEDMAARLAQLRQRMVAALRNRLMASRRRVEMLAGRPIFRWPLARVQQWARRVDEWEIRAHRAMRSRLERAHARVEALAGRLETLSPLAVLSRGYSLTQRESDGRIVREPADAPVGQRIITRLARGQIISRVEP